MAMLNDKARAVSFKVVTGTSENGKDKTATRTIKNINTNATLDDIQPVMAELAELQAHTIASVVLTDTGNLVAGE